jgi:tRNA(Ile)-lysidine synthase TilS/MesJ
MIQKSKLKKSVELVNLVHKNLNAKKILLPHQSVLLSVSGGQDSICLLLLFIQLRRQWSLLLGIVWCNHLWQKDSFYTMYHLVKVSISLRIPCYFLITSKSVWNEEKARQWRQDSIHRICSFYKYKTYTLGHSGSDRIESVLFHLIRGSGTQGLSTLKWQNRVFLHSKNRFHQFRDTKRKPSFDLFWCRRQRQRYGYQTGVYNSHQRWDASRQYGYTSSLLKRAKPLLLSVIQQDLLKTAF